MPYGDPSLWQRGSSSSSAPSAWQILYGGRAGGSVQEPWEAAAEEQRAARRVDKTAQVGGELATKAREDNRAAALRGLARMQEQGVVSGPEWDRLLQIAETGGEQQSSAGWLGKALQWFDRPGQLVRYAVADIFDIGEGSKITGAAYWDILRGNQKGLLERYGADVVGEDARMSGSQLLSLAGVEEATTGWGRFGRGLLSVGAELALDPLMLVGSGALGASRQLLASSTAEVGRRVAQSGLQMAKAKGAVPAVKAVAKNQRATVDAARRIIARHDELLTRNIDEMAEQMGVRVDMASPGMRAVYDDQLWQVAARETEKELVDQWAPRVLSRDWAHPDVALFVESEMTPAFLRGGLRVHPTPVLWNIPEHAISVPGTRGVGKQISRRLFGKSSRVKGQAKPTGARGAFERMFPRLSKTGYEAGQAFETSSYLRGVMKGDVSAYTLNDLRRAAARYAVTEGSTKQIERMKRGLEVLVRSGRRFDWTEERAWEVFNDLPARLIQEMPAGPGGAERIVRDVLRTAAVEHDDELVRGMVGFVHTVRDILGSTHRKAVSWGVLPRGAKIADYFPLVETAEWRALKTELARSGKQPGVGTVGEQWLSELLAGVHLERVGGARAVGEAQHARPRTFGTFVEVGPDAETVLLRTSTTQGLPGADEAAARVAATLTDTLDELGHPTFVTVDRLNREIGEAVADLAERAGAEMPRMPGGAQFRVFDTNVLTALDSYLVDMHTAIVHRALLSHMQRTGVLRVVGGTMHGHRTAWALAAEAEGHHTLMVTQIEKMIGRMRKQAGRAETAARAQVTLKVGKRTVDIPAGAASERVREFFRRQLSTAEDAVRVGREADDQAARYRNVLVREGVDEGTAAVLSRAPSLRVARQLMRQAKASLEGAFRLEVLALAGAVRQSGGTLADAAAHMLAARQALDEQKIRVRELSQATRAVGRFTDDLATRPMTEQQIGAAAEQLGETLATAQRAMRGLGEGHPVAEMVADATGRLIPALRSGDVAGAAAAVHTLDRALLMLRAARAAGDLPEVQQMAAEMVRGFAYRDGVSEADRTALSGLADRLALADPADVPRMLAEGGGGEAATVLARTQAGQNLFDDIAAMMSLTHGADDIHHIAGYGADLAADPAITMEVAGLRDAAYTARWLAQARHSLQGGARPGRMPADLDPARLERGLRELLGLPEEWAVTWRRTTILDGDGNPVRVWGPSFSGEKITYGATRGEVAAALAEAKMTARQARRLLLDPAGADQVPLTRAVRESLLHTPDELAGTLDEWIDAADELVRMERLAAGEMPDLPSWAPRVEFDEIVDPAVFTARLQEVGKLPVGYRVGGERASVVLGGAPPISSLLPAPDAGRLRGARMFLSRDGHTGFAVGADGEIITLFNVADPGRGTAALLEARAHGATWGMIPAPDERTVTLFSRAGMFDQIVQKGGRVRAGLPAHTMRQVEQATARHAAANGVLERVARLSEQASRGRQVRASWAEIESVLEDPATGRLFRQLEMEDRLDLLRRQMRAQRVLSSPGLTQVAADTVRASERMVRTMGASDRAEESLARMSERVRADLLTPEMAASQVGRDWLRDAEALRAAVADLRKRLTGRLPLVTDPGAVKEIRGLEDQVVDLADKLGFTQFAKSVRRVRKARPSTLVLREGEVLTKAYGLGGKQLKVAATNPYVAEMLESIVGHMQMLNTPAGLRFAAHASRSVIGWWKGMATVARPTFHVRNLIGGVANNMIGGVRVQDYLWVRGKMVRFRQLQSRVGTDEAIRRMGVRDGAVIRDALETGVLESSFARAELSRVVAPVPLRSRVNPLSQHGPAVRAGGEVMMGIEDFLRMAAFKRWHKTGGAQVAADWSFALHFDYRHLTPLETKIKTVVPFFVWTRRNIPLQMRALVERPDLIQKYQHLMHGLDDQYEPNAPYDFPIPGMYTDALSIGTGIVFNGDTPFWARAIIHPDLPITDLAEFDPFAPVTWVNFLTNQLGPHVALPFQLAGAYEDDWEVNAPAGLNDILMQLHRVGMYGNVNEAGQVARIPGYMRMLMEAGLPVWQEWTRPWETDPARRQAVGLGEGRQVFSPEVLRAMGLSLARGVGVQTVTPARTYSDAYRTQQEIQSLLYGLESRGQIPYPIPEGLEDLALP